MKLSVVIDRQGNIISLHEPVSELPACSSRLRVHPPEGGRLLSLEAPAEVAGKSLVEIHDAVHVDLSGASPVLKCKKH